jgi:replicative DNA helicase
MRRNLPLRSVPQEAASLGAERVVLGAMMLESANIELVAAKLSPSSFELPRHSSAFRAIVELASRREPTTPLAVFAELERRGDANGIGSGTLLDMVDEAGNNPAVVADPGYFAALVLEGAERRRQVVVARRLVDAIAQGAPSDELASIIAQAAPRKAPVAANALRSRELDEVLAAPAVEWLVEGLVQEVGVALLAAQSNTGKSLVAQSLAHAIVYGRSSWMGRTIDPALVGGSVVYLALEGAAGLPARFRALAAHHEGERRRGRLVITTPNEVGPILGQQGAPMLRAYLHEKALELAAGGAPLRALVVDTLAAAADGDENTTEGTRAALNTLGAIAQELGIAVLALHHVRKGSAGTEAAKRRPSLDDVRGAGAIVASVDQVLGLHADGEGIVLEVTKSRDGSKGTKLGAGFLSVVTGHQRRNGSDELAVVVVPRDLQGRQEAAEAAEAARAEEAKQRILEAARGFVEPAGADALAQAAGLSASRNRHLVQALAQAGALVPVKRNRAASWYGLPEVVAAWNARSAIGTTRDDEGAVEAVEHHREQPEQPVFSPSRLAVPLSQGRRDGEPSAVPLASGEQVTPRRSDDDRDAEGRRGTAGRRGRRKAQEQEGDA